MKKTERISYPELGTIYPGDYYETIPYGDYLKSGQPVPDGSVFDIRDYGAVPEEGLNTDAIRQACEACRDAGGGTVLVTGGIYRTGTVRIYSHTTLFVAPGSGLMASRDAADLIGRMEGTQDFGDESSGGALILAADAEDIAITGGGMIHGQGEWFVHEPRKKPAMTPIDPVLLPARSQWREINTVPGSIRTAYRERIRYAEDKYGEGKPVLRRPSAMVWLLRCRNVRVENILLRDSMCWTLHPEACDGVIIRNVVIDDNRHVANTDGLDISGCREVLAEHCFISCADDGICIKNPVYTHRESRDIKIRDCVVITVMNAFKIGTGTRYPIRDVTVEDCTFCMPDIYPGSVSGISIESCDGSVVENIAVRRIRMKGVQCPLYILLNRRNQAEEPYSDDPEALWWGGAVRRVLIEDITASDTDLPAIITGYRDISRSGRRIRKAPEDITVRRYDVRYREAGAVLNIPEDFGEFLTDYPESNAHGDVDACGIWVRHADRVTLEEIRVSARDGDPRKTVQYHDVK